MIQGQGELSKPKVGPPLTLGQVLQGDHGRAGPRQPGTSRCPSRMVGQDCRKRILSGPGPAILQGSVSAVTARAWPKGAAEGWEWPCHSFSSAALCHLPHISSWSGVLRALARGLLSWPVLWYFQEGSTSLVAVLVCICVSLPCFQCPFFTSVC